jgi:hypothetical protein
MKQTSRRWVPLVVAVLVVSTLKDPIAYADEVTDWNQTMLRAAVIAGTSPLNMSRVTAMVHAAIFDAVNGVNPRYTKIHVDPAAPAGASARAAAVQGAYVILSRLYGASSATQQGILDARRTVALLDIRQDEGMAAVNAGVAWGQTVADAIWTLRLADVPQGNFPDGVTPGAWRRTLNLPAPGTAAASAGYLQFSHMTPWSTSLANLIAQFRPGPPPALTSNTYTRDFNEVKTMGSFSSTQRSSDETIYALFWNSGTASYLWNRVLLSLVEAREGWEDDEWHWNRDNDDDHGWGRGNRRRLLENARIFAQLNVSMSDAAIGCWDAKYHYAFWRPITAIHEAASDGNPSTEPDATWSPLFPTPAHPDYPSGHSCVSGAASTVLAKEFDDRIHFNVESDTMIGVVRRFRSLRAALDEVKNARIFAGIHFRTACEVGQELGGNIANFVLDTLFQKID